MAEEVKVLQTIKVSPSPPLPSQPPQPLSFLDSIWLYSSHVERLFFYDFPHPLSHFTENLLHPLVKSLALTLRSFYLLAGALRRSPASEDEYEIVYTEGDSVPVTLAVVTGEDFRDISGHHPRDFSKLQQLVPSTPKSSSEGQSSLFSVRISLFPDQGLCIGIAVSHAVCDGSASTQFIRSWAAACRSAEGSVHIPAPFLDRSVIVDHHELRRKLAERLPIIYDTFKMKVKEEQTVKTFSSTPGLFCGTFTLREDQIALLKTKVQGTALKEGRPPSHISTFVVTCAYVWRCLVKARRHEDDSGHYFGCPVDWRQRMRPPVPGNYFGNCLGCCCTEMLTAGQIAGKDGVVAAAMAIGRCIDELKGKDVGEVIEEFLDKAAEMASKSALSVAGSPKLGVYGIDFGWGRPAKVEVPSIVESGAVSLAESREQTGGVEVGLVLTAEEMKVFGQWFGALDDQCEMNTVAV